MNRHVPLMFVALLLLSGCGPSTPPTGTPSAAPTPDTTPDGSPNASPAGSPVSTTTTVRAHFFLGSFSGDAGLVPVLREVPQTLAVGAAAMAALLAGREHVVEYRVLLTP
jgi:hypothetical protein